MQRNLSEHLHRKYEQDKVQQQELDQALSILKQKKKQYQISQVQFGEYPEFPLEIDAKFYLQDVLKLKTLQSKVQKVVMQYSEDETLENLIKQLFWFVFLEKFKKNKHEQYKQELSVNLSQLYTNLFILTHQQIDQKYELNQLLFTAGYVINHIFYNQFSNYRKYFTQQFNLDTYHTIFKQLYGVHLSNHYLFANFIQMFKLEKFSQCSEEDIIKNSKNRASVINISKNSRQKLENLQQIQQKQQFQNSIQQKKNHSQLMNKFQEGLKEDDLKIENLRVIQNYKNQIKMANNRELQLIENNNIIKCDLPSNAFQNGFKSIKDQQNPIQLFPEKQRNKSEIFPSINQQKMDHEPNKRRVTFKPQQDYSNLLKQISGVRTSIYKYKIIK